jgi:hypothetical protein
MTAETMCWLALAIMAGFVVFMVLLVFWVTQAPIMDLFCPKCGTVHGHNDGKCLKCGMGVQLWNRKGGGK